jgi:carbohydrate kinase (thermoresistant glucokinase family)
LCHDWLAERLCACAPQGNPLAASPAIATWIDETRAGWTSAMVTCSALKRAYRDVLFGDLADIGLVHLKESFALLSGRIGRRKNHFMSPALLKNQFATLEEPVSDENALVVSVARPPKMVARTNIAELGLSPRQHTVF